MADGSQMFVEVNVKVLSVRDPFMLALNLSLPTELSPLLATEQSLALQRADGHMGDLAQSGIADVELSKTL